MKDREVLITGASSYVGARIYHDLRERYHTVGTYNNTPLSSDFLRLDTTKPDDVLELVEKVKPNTIIHVAASADARWCNKYPQQARALNQEATKSVVRAAEMVGAGIIYISSYAAFNPSNVYGQTKAESERIINDTTLGHVVLRPSLVIGYSPNSSNNRPFNRLLRNIDQGIPAEYDTSWKFQPTYLGHLSQVITFVIDRGINAETIPVAVASLKSRFDIARDILSEFGIQVTAVDKQDATPVIEDDLSKLKQLGLPIYEYEDIIRTCVDEIGHREKFNLS